MLRVQARDTEVIMNKAAILERPRAREILQGLQQTSRELCKSLAHRLGISPSTIVRVRQRAKDEGVIRGTYTVLEPSKLGLHVLAFFRVFCQSSTNAKEVAERLARDSRFMEIHVMSGPHHLLVKARAHDNKSLLDIKYDIAEIEGVKSVAVDVALGILKETLALPI